MGAKGGGLTDLAVGSNGQTAGFLPDLSEKRPRGDWGLVLRNSARSIPASAKTGLILVQTSAAGFRKNGGHAQAGTCTETASWLLLAMQLAAVAFAAACAAVSAAFAAAFAAFVFAAFAAFVFAAFAAAAFAAAAAAFAAQCYAPCAVW